MASALKTDEARGNMAESLARRQGVADGHRPDGAAAGQAMQFEGRKKLAGAFAIELDRIVPDPGQPRTDWESDEARIGLANLATSLAARGQLQPIRVRWVDDLGRYMVVVGERRWRAAGMAGLGSIECVVIQGDPSPEDILEDQLVENALRVDNKPVEQARAYRRLMDARGYTHRDLAEKLSVDHGTVTRALALLNLPAPIQESVDSGEIRPQTGYELSRVDDPVEQASLAEEAKAGRLKRDEIRKRVSTSRPPKGAKGRGVAKAKLPTERTMKTTAGLKVAVTGRKGFDLLAWAEALEEVARQVRAKLDRTAA